MWDCTVCTFKNKDESFSCQMCNFPVGAVNIFDKNLNQSIQPNYSSEAGPSSYQSVSNKGYSNVEEDSDVSFETDEEDYLSGSPVSEAELEKYINKHKIGRSNDPTRGRPPPEGQGYAPVLIKFTLQITGPPPDDCSICMESLQNESGFGSDLGEHHTRNCGTNRCYNFRKITTNSVMFRVQAANDVSICLSPGNHEQPEGMYEVFLGAWRGTASAIRRKKKNDVVRIKTPNIVSADEIRGFCIEIAHGVIKVGLENEPQPFMSYTDPEILLHVTHYGFCTAYGSEGDWIFSDSEAEDVEALEKKRVLSLTKCHHMFHTDCLQQMVKDSPHHLQCPSCKTFHGHKTGIMPTGEMKVRIMQRPLPGYHDCNTIEIRYNINSGIQGPEHPSPGQRYNAVGFPRVGYLPNNTKGRKVLSLLMEAFKRRLTFTVGTSVTSGMQNVVTWNEIHHKTEFQARSGHGYPDPNYLDSVLMELSLQGVTDSDDNSSLASNFNPFTITSP